MTNLSRIVMAALGPVARGFVICFLVTVASTVFLSVGFGQIWVNPGGVGGPPPDQVSYSTNRLDLDMNGSTDFEIVRRVNTVYVAEIRGWAPRVTTTIDLLPMGDARILASDQGNSLTGDLPVLGEHDVVGPAKAGWHWSATAHNLVTRSEPSVLFGPLGWVWVRIPGKYFIGVSLGTPEAPVYAWLCFSDSVFNPSYWGYARQTSASVVAGDWSLAPPLKMKAELKNGHLPDWKWNEISWEPAFGEVTVEERVGLDGTWNPLVDPAIQTSRSFSVPVNAATPAGEVRLYRVRFGL